MSAEESRHEGALKKIDERVISKERLSWMQTPESEESVAPTQERLRDADRHPEITSGAAVKRDDTCDRLLGAISDTEIAKGMSHLMRANPHAATCAKPPRTPFPLAGAETQPSARVVQAVPAASPPHKFIVHTSPVGTSMPLMPPAATQPDHPARTEPDSTIEKEKTRERLLRAISEAGPPGGEIPASNPLSRFLVQTSPQAASVPLMPPIGATPHQRVSTAPRMIEAVTWDVGPQAPMPPQPMAVAEPAPGVTIPHLATPAQDCSPRTTIGAWYIGEINRLKAKLGRTTRNQSRALWQIPVRFNNRVTAKAGLTIGSTSRAATQLSIQFKDWMKMKAAPAIERLGRSVWQLSIRLWNLAEVKAALTMKSTSRGATQLSFQFKNWMNTKAASAIERPGRSLWQLSIRLWNVAEAKAALIMKSTDTAELQHSTRLGDRAHATQSAPDMESTSQDGSQFPTRFQKWFGPRRSSRLANPPVVAYCWTADTPHPVEIADISSGGVYLLTDARWPQGGMLSMTLQRTDRGNETPESWIVIDFMVIRLCDDGVAGAFIPSTHGLSRVIPSRAENCADDRTLKRFVRQLALPESA